MDEFKTMKEIGAIYGLTSHKLGKILKEQRLRTKEGRPSPKAFECGMVEQKHDSFGHYLWSWHLDKTKRLLDRLEYEEKARAAKE